MLYRFMQTLENLLSRMFIEGALMSKSRNIAFILIQQYKSILEEILQINIVTYYLSTLKIFPPHLGFQKDFCGYLF